jgi:hypothetical protein
MVPTLRNGQTTHDPQDTDRLGQLASSQSAHYIPNRSKDSSGGSLDIILEEDRRWKCVLAYNPKFGLLAEADSTKTNITDSWRFLNTKQSPYHWQWRILEQKSQSFIIYDC